MSKPTFEEFNQALEQFSQLLANDPKLAERLKKRGALGEFKEKYKIQGASPFKCPSCASLMPSPGTLWGPKEGTSDEFVCRKCRLEWRVQCLTKSNKELMEEIKTILKGDKG